MVRPSLCRDAFCPRACSFLDHNPRVHRSTILHSEIGVSDFVVGFALGYVCLRREKHAQAHPATRHGGKSEDARMENRMENQNAFFFFLFSVSMFFSFPSLFFVFLVSCLLFLHYNYVVAKFDILYQPGSRRRGWGGGTPPPAVLAFDVF